MDKLYSSKKEKDYLVQWRCQKCGYEWLGKSPRVRIVRPYCCSCGSWNVRVKDWLIDREKWEKAKIYVLKRANYKCQGCGKKISDHFSIHHLNYNNYYNVNNLVCLCPRCHFLIHGRDPAYKSGQVSLVLGIISIVISIPMAVSGIIMYVIVNYIYSIILVIALAGLVIGVILIYRSLRLTKETRMVQYVVRTRKFQLKSKINSNNKEQNNVVGNSQQG